jgi:transcriptional regulator GlxA family with amidase domain
MSNVSLSCVLAADCALRDLVDETVDTLIVTGGPALNTASTDVSLIREITRIASRARRTCSICTGASILAAAGLLDGRRATTHWAVSARLRKQFPAMTVESDKAYIRDGPIATSGGVSAGIDLALSLIDEDLGSRVTLSVACWLVVFA